MKHHKKARIPEARRHRQLEPTDVHAGGSGATALQVLSRSRPARRAGEGLLGPLSTRSDSDASSDSIPGLGTGGGPAWSRRRVLLLNATYEPLTALPARRAIVLLICDKADAIHQDPAGPVLHSAGTTVAVPSVIRLRTYVRVPYRGRIPMTRTALMHRDRYRCGYCGGKAETIDHVIPRSRGGQHGWENCVASCASCNHRKADKLLGELGWRLQVPLVPPKGQHWRLLSTINEVDPSWVQYLQPAA